jgi:hypothetical protein
LVMPLSRSASRIARVEGHRFQARLAGAAGHYRSLRHPAMVLAHSRACLMSPMPGNSRRSATAADSSGGHRGYGYMVNASSVVGVPCPAGLRPALF